MLARLSWRQVRSSRLLIMLLSAAAISWLVFAILIYLHFNTGAIALLQIAVNHLIPINAGFFHTFLGIQAMLAFFLVLLIIPPVFSRDLAHQALPYYLSRPLSKLEYVCGKLIVATTLLSAVTWLPGLLLFGLQAGLAGSGWGARHGRIALALFLGSLLWIAIIALPAAAISAWTRRRLSATAALIGWFLVPGIFAGIVNRGLTTPWGDLISPSSLIKIAWRGLFQLPQPAVRPMFYRGRMVMQAIHPVPAGSAYFVIVAICALSAAILWRRLEPLRGVRG